ncbi:MAG: SGNH/GDSL hydrolase family protein [Clostridia bacterium]|jgi:acyl-CoA thioesterase-1|nr:SGNH/GDSL hydrolase family protein [Clostridiaceae bacterium]
MNLQSGEPNVKILLYGDSIAKGIVFDESSNKYTKEKDCFFNILSSKLKATIENVSKFGNTLIRANRKFDEELAKIKPDMTMIEFGGNDCDFDWDKVAQDPKAPHLPHTPPEEFESLLSNFILRMQKQNIMPLLLTMPPIDPFRYFKWICKGKSSYEENILTFLGSEHTIYRWHEKYNLMILEQASLHRVPVVDIRKAFLSHLDIQNYLCQDGIHPNGKGHKLIADTVFRFMKSRFPQLVL